LQQRASNESRSKESSHFAGSAGYAERVRVR